MVLYCIKYYFFHLSTWVGGSDGSWGSSVSALATDGGCGEGPRTRGRGAEPALGGRDSEAQQAAPSHGGHGWNTWVAVNVEQPGKREKNKIQEYFIWKKITKQVFVQMPFLG